MSYRQPSPIRSRSITEMYSGKLHNYSPMYHQPKNPYLQYSGILRYLKYHLDSAEQRHLKSEAEKKEEKKKEVKDKAELSVSDLEYKEIG